jgi:23S rRNA (cytidine2498-2'-O)-methyltransferase
MSGGPLPLRGRVYHTISGFEDHLQKELEWAAGGGSAGHETWGPLFYYPIHGNGNSGGPPIFWHQNVWLNPLRIEFDSIGGAAAVLRASQRNWRPVLFTQFRRGALITEKLPPVSLKPRSFPWDLPTTPMGAFTLLDAHTMIAASDCTSPFPGGVVNFMEDKSGPPSRAYLKCWEALTRLRHRPAAGERCLDAGASPGGWTWALARLGAAVTAVDRAPLDDAVAALPQVAFIKHDAFTLKPADLGPLDWLFCDAACYPPRLYDWVEKWLASGLCKNFVCTIKMQGAAAAVDFDTPRRFAAIPGSQVVHLYHNKHELTWMAADLFSHPSSGINIA